MTKGKRKREEHGEEVTRDEEGEKLPEEEMIETGCGCGSGNVGAERALAMHRAGVWTDEDEWAVSAGVVQGQGSYVSLKARGTQDWRQIGDPILHIEVSLPG
jgi:hypothetical protein